MRAFETNLHPDGLWGDRNWADQYPYTVIAYQHGKRIKREYHKPKDVADACEAGEDFSVGVVITPNGKAWTREEFMEQYNKEVGHEN